MRLQSNNLPIIPLAARYLSAAFATKQKSQDSHIKSLGRILQPSDFIYMLMLEVVVILMPHSVGAEGESVSILNKLRGLWLIIYMIEG